MNLLYLDESGDLGCNFTYKKTSKYFTITILELQSLENEAKLMRMVKKTIDRKLNPKNKKKIHELKGINTTLDIKKYFYHQIKDIDLKIHSLTIDKRKLPKKYFLNKNNIYNNITLKILEKILFSNKNIHKIRFIIDKSKGKEEINRFNKLVEKYLVIKNKIPTEIYHKKSQESKGLQACDLFSYGIFSNYENNHEEWLNLFREKVINDKIWKVNSVPHKINIYTDKPMENQYVENL